jgi:thiol-disulfide isomerase/thioredoxin
MSQDYKYIKYKSKYLKLSRMSNNNLMFGGYNENDKNDKNKKPTIKLFKSENCGWCAKFEPTWEELSKNLNSKYNFISYEYTNKNDKKHFEENNVKGFPTILLDDKGTPVEYDGDRDFNTIKNFLEKMYN